MNQSNIYDSKTQKKRKLKDLDSICSTELIYS